MARPFRYTENELKKAKKMRDNPTNERDVRASVSFILMAETGVRLKDLGSAFGVTPQTIHKDILRVRNPDPANKGIWGGDHNRLMTIEEELEFLNEYWDDAKSGHIITMPELHNEYNKRVGKQTPKSTFYRMIKRHKWRKVLPDTRHPKGDPLIQEDFKKKHLKWKWKKF